ncbi:MAG: hypothetical protein DRO99_02050 [Candidatus Aenigmatarchaeota archaeon]|mgnify:CR=1 FL=1|nr:MAG: hypothetical protein DRO99_02050 [Candidatus Aenigmarchaeota archaeon]
MNVSDGSVDTWARKRDEIKKYLADPGSFTSIAIDAIAWAIGETRNYGTNHEDHVSLAVENSIMYLLDRHAKEDVEDVFRKLYQLELDFHEGNDAMARGSVGEIVLCNESLSEHETYERVVA